MEVLSSNQPNLTLLTCSIPDIIWDFISSLYCCRLSEHDRTGVNIFLPSCKVAILFSCIAVSLLIKIWKKPANNCRIFMPALNFQVTQQAAQMKQKKNPQVMGFANLYKSRLRLILAARISLGTKKVTNWSLTTFKGKISVSIVVFKFVQLREKVPSY